MQLTLGKDKYDQLSLHATGSALQEQYEALQEAKYVAGNRMVLDSLDHMFYEAREKGIVRKWSVSGRFPVLIMRVPRNRPVN